jgi:hypothetical protein
LNLSLESRRDYEAVSGLRRVPGEHNRNPERGRAPKLSDAFLSRAGESGAEATALQTLRAVRIRLASAKRERDPLSLVRFLGAIFFGLGFPRRLRPVSRSPASECAACCIRSRIINS